MKAIYLPALFFTCLLGLAPVIATAQPYVISADGSEVTDLHTGLIWRRCSEGMSWSGTTCTGIATVFTHEAALQQAASQTSISGIAWRLPNVKELNSIADKTLINPAINPSAFPATPIANFWSSSPNVVNNGLAQVIYSGNGTVGTNTRSANGDVRLVRTGQ
jgi:hypothetical protein